MSSARGSLLCSHQIAEVSASETSDKNCEHSAKTLDCEASEKNPFSASGSMTDQRSATESRYSAFTRDSILSDPRLSQVRRCIFNSDCTTHLCIFQLFDISQQLEALAESIPTSPSLPPKEQIYFHVTSLSPNLSNSFAKKVFFHLNLILNLLA